MCTLIVLRRPGHAWPLVVAANRDEMIDRPWRPPGRHWPDRPGVIAGKDELAGGSWFGMNDDGLVAGIMNRRGSLGPAAGLRTRGELVLEALDHADALSAAQALADLNPAAYRSFNLVVADRRDAFWLRHTGADRRPQLSPVADGLSMFTAGECNDPADPRIAHYLPLFRTAAAPAPETGDWQAWQTLLASRQVAGPNGTPLAAMNVVTDRGFGTVSSTLLALPATAGGTPPAAWLFAAGRPDEAPFHPVSLA